MNREILFKGFHPCENGKDKVFINGEWINGEWIEGSLITGVFVRFGQDIPYIICPDKADYDCFEDISEENGIFEVIPETVGQYTGLTDKNRKKIFEGDIVKTHYANTNKTEFVEQVIFEGGGFRAQTKYKDNSSHSAPLYDGTQHIAFDKSVYMDSIEVIGNIHDNPELLEAAE